jgi:hypothetical protein
MVAYGDLRSTCMIAVEATEDGAAAGSASGTTDGRDWIGFGLAEDALYTAEGTWADCTNIEAYASGSFAPTAFSGVSGTLALFHYDGITTEFSTLTQAVDYEGGVALVTFDDGVDGVEAAASAGYAAVPVEEGYRVAWTDEAAVGAVLAALSEVAGFDEGSPSWLQTPAWW